MKKLLLSVAMLATLTTATFAEDISIDMLNKRDDGAKMVYSQDIARIDVGDTITWLPASKGHNVEFIAGPNRWKAPRKISNSSQIIVPKENNFCVQRPSGMGGSEGDGFFSGSEDCLYLDIKTPSRKSYRNTPRPFAPTGKPKLPQLETTDSSDTRIHTVIATAASVLSSTPRHRST